MAEMTHRTAAFVLLSLAMLAGAAAPAPAPAQAKRTDLQPHRAIYSVDLADSAPASGVTGAAGRMVFEMTGDLCAGYSTRQRLVVSLSDDEGNGSLLDFQISSFESGSGDLFRFDSRTKVNQEVIEDLKGVGRRGEDVVDVTFERPSAKTVPLDGSTLFPAQYMRLVLDAARNERRFVQSAIYEGSASDESADQASTLIGEGADDRSDLRLLDGMRSWPVSIGYFGGSRDDAQAGDFGEETPSYQMSFRLFENGVAETLIMDYGTYALRGTLEKLEKIEAGSQPACAPR